MISATQRISPVFTFFRISCLRYQPMIATAMILNRVRTGFPHLPGYVKAKSHAGFSMKRIWNHLPKHRCFPPGSWWS